MDAAFLSALVAEARPVLEGARVLRAAAEGPEGLVLGLEGQAGPFGLHMGWEAWGPRWYLGAAAGGRAESPFPAVVEANLRGGRITRIVRPGMERAVALEVVWRRGQALRRLALWTFLWPAGRNAVLVDAEAGLVIAAARPGKWRPGAPFMPPEAPPATGLSRPAAPPAGPFSPCILLDAGGNPEALAAIAPPDLPADRRRPYASAHEAARAFFEARRARAALGTLRRGVERALREARRRTARRAEKLEAELASHREAIANRRLGEILVAHQRAVPRGAAQISLPDPYGPPGAARIIPLDPALSAAANAARYFQRARRGARGEAAAAQRLAAARRELERLAELEKALAEAATPEALGGIAASLGGAGRAVAAEGRAPRREARPDPVARVARRFRSSDGLPILVGRNNAANDELTLHVARPHDLWLHVEGFGGSHVVVRLGDRAEPPRRTLAEAAQLAAYYSQARGQRKVPVHYTLRKYVRKPRGAKPGLVTITQEKTILATPDPALVRRLADAAGPEPRG